MRILITNDDGIRSPGLTVLELIAAAISSDVWVVAPEADCSDAFTAPTICKPLKLHQVSHRRYSLDGTPADCALVGIKHLLPDQRPGLLLAGINAGENLADDIYHSGTVAAAIHATLLDVPSISLSLVTGGKEAEAKWHTASSYGADLLSMLLKRGWPDNVLLNVNFPDCEPDRIKGVTFTKQGKRTVRTWSVRDAQSERGQELCIERQKSRSSRDTDLWAVEAGRISVTPIKTDLTAGMLEPVDLKGEERAGGKPGRHDNAARNSIRSDDKAN